MGLYDTRRTRRPSVRITWNRLHRWFSRHIPEVLESLNPGASDQQIAELEAFTRRTLTDDVKQSLMIHNGQQDVTTGAVFGLLLLPIERICRSWEIVRRNPQDGAESKLVTSDPRGAVQLCDSHPGWIPLTDDWSGNHIGIDLAPGLKGAWGQAIVFGQSEGRHYVAANSWAELLADIADELADGNFRVERSAGGGQIDYSIDNPPVRHFHEAIAYKYVKRR
jgi:cell wall assembly regulator SMI1